MPGGLAFLTHGHLTVGVDGDGLIARIGAVGMGAAVAEPGVRPFDITGRPMRGIIVVAADALDDRALERWIRQARSYAAACRPSGGGPSRRRAGPIRSLSM
jgi:hypothetical protein